MKTALLWFSIILFLSACADNDKRLGEEKNSVKHVFLIGLDGWNTRYVETEMPFVKSMMTEGAYTLKNRAVIPTSSAPNWASMFMGVGPEIHGYLQWGSREPEFDPVELNHYGMFPGIFGLIRDSSPDAEIGYLFNWDVMNYLVDTLVIDYRVNIAGVGDLTNSAVHYILDRKPAFCAIIYGEPDDTGHQYGWESAEYLARLAELDDCIQKLIKAVEDAGMLSESIIILASDHGGIDKKHGGNTLDEFESPLVFWGAGIRKGEIPVSTMKYDIAPTIAYLFGIKTPSVWVGRPIVSVLW